MPTTKKYSELRAKMPPEARQAADRLRTKLREELPLHELREARRLTQQQLAAALGVSQSSVSQIERSSDLYLSTLAKFVEAMGGRLDLVAVFPEGTVRLLHGEVGATD
jgi:DNA-binding XRE family transcriptional regulator